MWIYIIVILVLIYTYFSRVGKDIHGLWKSDEYMIFINETSNPIKTISIISGDDEASKGTMILFPIFPFSKNEKWMCMLWTKYKLPKCSTITWNVSDNIFKLNNIEFVKLYD